eukprot:c15994_g1_i6.p1 GENE.c15994_g1_i6~~c15994_g1_i6.p1  ORF type:complete len:287 (-),score=33.00 c15994_g1_i6:608-1468(-)
MSLVLLLCAWTGVLGSNFDPHVPWHVPTQSYFAGWFFRVISPETNSSFAFIAGLHRAIVDSEAAGPTTEILASQYNFSWVVFMENTVERGLQHEEAFHPAKQVTITKRGVPITADPEVASPSEFEWVSPVGSFAVNDSIGHLNLTFPSHRIEVSFSNRIPWDIHSPNAAGPVGILTYFPSLLPCTLQIVSVFVFECKPRLPPRFLFRQLFRPLTGFPGDLPRHSHPVKDCATRAWVCSSGNKLWREISDWLVLGNDMNASLATQNFFCSTPTSLRTSTRTTPRGFC